MAVIRFDRMTMSMVSAPYGVWVRLDTPEQVGHSCAVFLKLLKNLMKLGATTRMDAVRNP